MEPVELEFIMRNGALGSFKNVNDSMDTLDEKIQNQTLLIDVLERALYSLQKAHSKAGESANFEQNEAEVKAYTARIEELKKELTELQAQQSKPVNAPIADPTPQIKKLNMLNFQIQQVARELPSLAMGPQMFFLAISNNLPMLTDEITKAKNEYNALTAAGQKATPVWKQVLGGVLSWQTALVTGITLLVVYGKEIVNWTKSLGGAKKMLSDTITTNEDFRKAVSESATKLISSYKDLQQKWKDMEGDLTKQKQFISDNQDAFKKLEVSVLDVNNAETLFNDGTDRFVQSLIERAKAAAAMEIAGERFKEAIEKMQKADAMPEKKTHTYSEADNVIDVFKSSSWKSVEYENPERVKAKKEAEDIFKDGENLIRMGEEYSEQADKLVADMGLKTQEIVAGSVAQMEDIIKIKKDQQKRAVSKEEYDALQKDIDAQQKKLDAITGGKKGKNKETEDKTAQYRADAELKIAQLEIEAMKEGAEKKRAQAKLEYDREIQQITEQEQKRIEALKKAQKAGLKVDPKESDTIKSQSDTMRTSAKKAYENKVDTIDTDESKKVKEKYDKLLKPYLTYAEQRLEIEKKFLSQVEELRAGGASDDNIEQARQAMEKEQQALDMSVAAKETSFRVLASRLSRMSMEELIKQLSSAEKMLKAAELGDGKNSQAAGVARAKITMLQNELKTVKAEQEIDDPKGLQKWDRTSAAIKKCKGEVDGMISSMDFLDDTTKEALQAASNIAGGAIAMIDGIMLLSKGAAEGISAVEKASVILAIIGTAVQIMSTLFSFASKAEEKHQKALEEINTAKLAAQREYNLLLMQQNMLMKEASSIFGDDEIVKATKAVEIYRSALEAYKNELSGSRPSYQGGDLNAYVKQLNAYREGIAGLSGIEIVTGHKKTGLFGWGKGKDIYSSVLDVYPDLLDAENKLNVARAQAILNNEKMSDANKALLQSMIDLQQQAEEAEEALRSYLQDTFGDIGPGVMDALTEAITTGADAWDIFRQKGSDALEKLGKQVAYTLFFSDKFKKLEDELVGIYSSGKKEEDIAKDAMDLIGKFYENIGSSMNASQEWLEKWKEEAKKNGFDLWENGDAAQKGGAGAFQSMSQEQGTKLEGLFTSVQDHVSSMDDKMDDLADVGYESLDVLRSIDNNTRGCNEKLEKLSNDINEIKRDGLKVK